MLMSAWWCCNDEIAIGSGLEVIFMFKDDVLDVMGRDQKPHCLILQLQIPGDEDRVIVTDKAQDLVQDACWKPLVSDESYARARWMLSHFPIAIEEGTDRGFIDLAMPYLFKVARDTAAVATDFIMQLRNVPCHGCCKYFSGCQDDNVRFWHRVSTVKQGGKLTVTGIDLLPDVQELRVVPEKFERSRGTKETGSRGLIKRYFCMGQTILFFVLYIENLRLGLCRGSYLFWANKAIGRE